ncbi:solute carrier family 22 member 15-like isoform X2 [Nematostella vectensis]|uniref:solute carrier family 22 member 15-like isoform X2 n=1 Tax=Nematostella vectensis TaxID=45351 RepID=UPI0020774866|nr:solute carrier family 22 member 15-like isoform X2 [Nematostella vectensis]
MANSAETMDKFWIDSFSNTRKELKRNTLLLSIIAFTITYQIIALEFFVEEEAYTVCNSTEIWIPNNHSADLPTRTTFKEVDFADSGKLLLSLHYLSMLIGVISLGLLADKFGRRKILFSSLALAFCASLIGSVFIKKIAVFVPFMMLSGFASGMSLLIVFILVAEYVNPGRRPLVLAAIWLSSTLSCISFAGLAYLVDRRRVLMLGVSLPLLVMVLFYKIIPESPRWVYLKMTTAPSEESPLESQMLLRHIGSQDDRWGKKKVCWPVGVASEGYCFKFLKEKQSRRNALVLAHSWFSIGMLYRALNTSSIQLLHNFYINYSIRELINLPSFLCFVLLATCVGRRFTTLISMVLSGVLCVIFAAASDGFIFTAYDTLTIIIQLLGRFFVVLSMTSLGVYSIELFPTSARCSALGLVTSFSFLGAAISPLFMSLQSLNPMVPLAMLGSVSLFAGVLIRVMLPETKGAMTSETLEDTVVGRRTFNKPWSPKVRWARTERRDESGTEEEVCPGRGTDQLDTTSYSDSIDEYKDLRKSWEVSFDRASRTSKWEWLSYEDANRSLPSLDIELSLHDESHLLDDDDHEKLSEFVPGNAWILLYSTFTHGISLKTLYYRLQDVQTPIMLVIKDSQGYVFGVYSPVPLRVNPGFYGYGRSFFFTCKPEYKVYPCSGKNEYYLNCNTDSLAFGCSDGLFGLWLDSELYRGRSTACETYNSDVLSANEDFICIGLEVWTFA